MAIRGLPWECSNSKIIQALNDAKGRITHATKLLDVDYKTLVKKLESEPELQDALKESRMLFEDQVLDMAETCIANAMAKQEFDPNNALKAAMYTLNSKGRSRNWNNTYVHEGAIYLVRQDPTKPEDDSISS